MGLKRREFLQRAGGLLASIGMSETLLWQVSDRARSVLAQPNGRKLALLVGINQYGAGSTLAGCVTDVELQRELLMYRFGFQPQDIVTLADSQATRKNIEEAFQTHLIAQASEDDLVVFHFSGYGRCLHSSAIAPAVASEKSPLKQTFAQPSDVNALVPADSPLSADGIAVSDLLEETLWQLLRSLRTERSLAVVDASYTYPGTPIQGNLRIRSRPSPLTESTSTETIPPQQPLAPQNASLHLENSKGKKWPGVFLTAASPGEVAAELAWNGFSAGVFTYALTQSLWWATPARSLRFSFQRAACTVEQLAGTAQQPQWLSDAQKRPLLPPDVFLNPPADGAVTAVGDDGKTAQVWLGGLPGRILESYGVNSLLSVAALPERDRLLLQIRSRSGLSATVHALNDESAATSPLQVGQLVRESVRVLPRTPSLTVALDTALERIERVDATSAFATIPYVSPVIASEQPADCLFGRVRETLLAATPTAALPSLAPSSYGLFSLGQNLIPDTVGEGGEAVKAAVRRLAPQLHALLAAKLWRSTANEGSSRLGIAARLEVVESPSSFRVRIERESLRFRGAAGGSAMPGEEALQVVTLPAGSRIHYRLSNHSDRPVYYLLLGLDSRGRAIAGCLETCAASAASAAAEKMARSQPGAIAPGQTVTIPAAETASAYLVRGTPGLAETQIVCSIAPFSRTLAALAGDLRPRSDGQPILVLSNPLAVAQALLQDLHQASAPTAQIAGVSADAYALDVAAYATLNFIYRVA